MPIFSVLAATNVVKVLVSKLPSDGHQKTPSCEVVVNMCGALNNLVSSSSLAARDISYFNGIPKLVGIKTSHDNRWATLLSVMLVDMGGSLCRSARLQANVSRPCPAAIPVLYYGDA